MLHNKKGFTLVEILATIIILGLLVTLGYVSVRNILDQSHENYYKSQEDMVLLAGREYFADYRSALPEEVGETATVTLETLINEKYIDPVKDRNENDCDFKASSVTVQKINEKDYQYYVTLKCSDYLTNKDDASPVIKYTPNKGSSHNSISVTMKITDNKKVDTYRYVVTKDGEAYKDSGYQKYNGDISFTFTEKGLYEIRGYAMDSSGNTTNRKSGKYSIYDSINCGEASISANVNENTWTNKTVNLDITVPSNTYRYEVSSRVNNGAYSLINSYIGSSSNTISLENDGNNEVKVVAYDQNGGSCTISSGVYKIDKTPPYNLTVTNNPGCVTRPTTISPVLSATETGSGIAKWQWGYSTTDMHDYENSAYSPFTSTPYSEVRNQLSYFRACDKAGNCSNFASTAICIQNPAANPSVSKGGNTGKWIAIYRPRGNDGYGTCAYNGNSQVCGNIIGKIDVTWVNRTVTINWEIRQGPYTWVANGYYVNLIIDKNGASYASYQIKASNGAAWNTGSTHRGSRTVTLSAGTYSIGFSSNTFDPSYNSSLATITVK